MSTQKEEKMSAIRVYMYIIKSSLATLTKITKEYGTTLDIFDTYNSCVQHDVRENP